MQACSSKCFTEQNENTYGKTQNNKKRFKQDEKFQFLSNCLCIMALLLFFASFFLIFFFTPHNWSQFSEYLSVHFLQFKDKLQSRTEPSLADWFLQINLSHSKNLLPWLYRNERISFTSNSFLAPCQTPSLSLSAYYIHTGPPLFPHAVPKCLWIPPSWPPSPYEQLARTAGFNSCLPSHFWPISIWATFSTALSFFCKPAFLFLNQSLCYHCAIQPKMTLKQTSQRFIIGIDVGSICSRSLDVSATISRIHHCLWKKAVPFLCLDFASNH